MRKGTLWTIGHSTRLWDAFLDVLQDARIQTLVDVRRHAGSRRNPQFSPLPMAPALREVGIDYWPMPEFGGRRTADKDSPNTHGVSLHSVAMPITWRRRTSFLRAND